MTRTGTSVINSCFDSHADRTAAYRLMNNKRLTMKDMVERIAIDSASRCRGLGHVLCIQDTSEFSFDSHGGRLSLDDPDLGYGNSRDESFCQYLHAVLLVDASSDGVVGLGHMDVYNHPRSMCRSKSRLRGSLRLEGKESFRWADSAERTARLLPRDVRKTFIGDRESDIYPVLCRTLGAGCDFLVRSRHDRKTGDDLRPLSERMSSLPVSHRYDLPLVSHKGTGTVRRTARMCLRFSKVRLNRPAFCVDDVPDSLDCWCVWACEDASTVPPGCRPVEWRLLTSHEVSTVAQAVQCVGWYRCRWLIEELFRVCKSKGFRMESSQLGRGDALRKLTVLTAFSAMRCMALKRAFDNSDESAPCDRMFSRAETEVLRLENHRIHSVSPGARDGNNPFAEGSLPWAAWTIARLGGWSGYPSAHGAPGYITMKKGLDIFNIHCEILECREAYKRHGGEVGDVYKD